VPELPEVESARRLIAPAMARSRIDGVELHRPDLREPFPRRFVNRLTGETVLSLDRRGKYLLALLSSGETLLMHLGMSGSFRVERDRRMAGRHAVLTITSSSICRQGRPSCSPIRGASASWI
jgi:formamidopyrimidine-DNA glycosylase